MSSIPGPAFSPAVSIVAAILVGALSVQSAWASPQFEPPQDTPPQAAVGVPAAGGVRFQPGAQIQTGIEALGLTLEEAVRRALENNPDLALVELSVEGDAALLTQAESAFDPVISASVGRSRDTFPPTNFLFDAGVETDDWFGSGVIRQRLRWWGGTWLVGFDGARTDTESTISNFNPVLRSNLMLAFSQPLFKDRSIDGARQQVTVANRTRTLSDLQFKETVVRTVAAVKTAYWELKASLANVDLQDRSVRLAEELVSQNQARVQAGQLPELEVVAAQAEVSRRQSQLILARHVVGDAEDRLRGLIIAPGDRDFWSVRLNPIDEPDAAVITSDLEQAVATALDSRLDLLRARQRVEDVDADLRYYRNQQLPDVRLEFSYGPTGLGGVPLPGGGLFPPVIEDGPVTFGSTVGQVFRAEYPAWSVGFTVSHLLGNQFEDGRLARATVERAQAEQRLFSLETQATQQIRAAARQLESTAERVKATRAGAELASERVRVEQARYELGLSTPFAVTQAQRDLVEAEVALIRATLDYQTTAVAFDALRTSPMLGDASEFALRGATLLPILPTTPNGTRRSGASGLF